MSENQRSEQNRTENYWYAGKYLNTNKTGNSEDNWELLLVCYAGKHVTKWTKFKKLSEQYDAAQARTGDLLRVKQTW